MAIEEFDNRKHLFLRIQTLDEILETIYGITEDPESVGNSKATYSGQIIIMLMQVDKSLLDRFKQLLLERKQELINEFEK